MRSIIRLIFFAAALLLISPFIISSLLIDQRGVILNGRVVSKDERIIVHSSSWTRKLDVTVQYAPPDESGVAFTGVEMQPEGFDSLKTGSLVQLRYLRKEDLPNYPAIKTLRQMHLLPTVRFANQRLWSGLEAIVETHRTTITVVLSVAAVLFLWRLLRVRYFAWVLLTCALVGLGISYISEFPKPMPAPQHNLRTAKGTVKSIDTWKWLFRGNRRRGLLADQPIEIAGVQFIPEGRTEPVLAVDLIDAGSVPGLKEHGSITVEYDAEAPRTALIRSATRHFPVRNLRGIAVQGVAVLILLVIVWTAGLLFRKIYRRLLRRSLP